MIVAQGGTLLLVDTGMQLLRVVSDCGLSESLVLFIGIGS